MYTKTKATKHLFDRAEKCVFKTIDKIAILNMKFIFKLENRSFILQVPSLTEPILLSYVKMISFEVYRSPKFFRLHPQ